MKWKRGKNKMKNEVVEGGVHLVKFNSSVRVSVHVHKQRRLMRKAVLST